MIRFYIGLFFLMALTASVSCGNPVKGVIHDTRDALGNGGESLPIKTPTETAKDKVKDALNEREKAVQNNDELGKLKAEKKALAAQYERLNLEREELKMALGAKDKEIDQERLNIAREKSFTIAAICGFLGIVAIAASFFIQVPLLTRLARFAAGVMFSIATLCLVFAWLVPYIWPIVGVLSAVMVVAGVVAWRNDHQGLSQVVKAVEPIKKDVDGMADRLRDSLSKGTQARVNQLRRAFGLKKD